MAAISSVWDTSSGSGLTTAQTEKLAIIAHGTQTAICYPEVGTFDADVTTGSDREVAARLWSGTNDGEGRWVVPPLVGRTGGNVIIRLWTVLGVSGSAGEEVAWAFSADSYGIGETLSASLPNDQTVYQDVSAQVAHVVTAFDITVLAAVFDQTQSFCFKLERLSNADARDDYTAGTLYLPKIEAVYTGWGIIASPSAPA